MDVLLPDFYVHAVQKKTGTNNNNKPREDGGMHALQTETEWQAAGSELVKPFQTRELIQLVTSLQDGAEVLNHGNMQ